jgi:hypothetical protein
MRLFTVLGSMTAVAALACGDNLPPDRPPGQDPSGADPDPSDALFDPDHLVEIEIELQPADWETLRVQHTDLFGRLVEDCPGPLPPDPYTIFPATVTIDGERLEEVGVRKKGYVGSVSRVRPALKISFDEYEPGREAFGLERLTLNNNLPDTSQLDTCLAFQVFRDAGLAAPRCNWAHVTVNGQDLGIYSNVESVRRRFLGRHFEDQGGNLYEGSLSDLRDIWIDNYEDKGGNDGDRSDLLALEEAASAGDADLLAALDPLLDVDEFLTFWAAEVLVGHWDGYSGNQNNHFLYRDPAAGKFHFLPWGPDSAFGDRNIFLPPTIPRSVWANSILTRRLYALDETHRRYQDRLRELLDTVWDEPALLAEIDRVRAMIEPHVHVEPDDFDRGVTAVRDFITAQRDVLETDLAADPAWDVPLLETYCARTAGTASGTFSAPFGDFPPANPFAGSGTLSLTIDGKPLAFQSVTAGAGHDHDPEQPRIGAAPFGLMSDGDLVIAMILVEPEVWAAGTFPIDGFDVFSLVLRANLAAPENASMLGIARGTLTLDAAPTTSGETVSGSFELELFNGAM